MGVRILPERVEESCVKTIVRQFSGLVAFFGDFTLIGRYDDLIKGSSAVHNQYRETCVHYSAVKCDCSAAAPFWTGVQHLLAELAMSFRQTFKLAVSLSDIRD